MQFNLYDNLFFRIYVAHYTVYIYAHMLYNNMPSQNFNSGSNGIIDRWQTENYYFVFYPSSHSSHKVYMSNIHFVVCIITPVCFPTTTVLRGCSYRINQYGYFWWEVLISMKMLLFEHAFLHDKSMYIHIVYKNVKGNFCVSEIITSWTYSL